MSDEMDTDNGLSAEEAKAAAELEKTRVKIEGMDLPTLLDIRWTWKTRIEAIQATIADEVALLNKKMLLAENEIRKSLTPEMQSVSTKTRKAYYRKSANASIADADVFFESLAVRIRAGESPTGVFSAMERRIKVGWVSEYVESNDGAVPAGVNYSTARTLVFS